MRGQQRQGPLARDGECQAAGQRRPRGRSPARSASSCSVQPSRQRSRAMRWPSISGGGHGAVGSSGADNTPPARLARPQQLQVGVNHPVNKRREVDRWRSSRAPCGPWHGSPSSRSTSAGPDEALVLDRVLRQSSPTWSKAIRTKSRNRVRLAGRDARSRPAASCWSISHMPRRSRRRSPSRARRPGCRAAARVCSPSLIRATASVILRVDELLAPARRLVVEQDAATGRTCRSSRGS